MATNLKRCIDCGKPLSVTAQVCNECNSTDPFGGTRLNNKIYWFVMTILTITALTVGGLWYTGLINPLNWLALI